MSPTITTAIRTIALALAATLPLAAAAQKKPSDIPLEDFFKRAEYAEMMLSPDGAKLAALTPLKGRDNLVVVDLGKRTTKVITGFENIDASRVFWVNNRRLCLSAVDGKVVTGEPNYRGFYCIDADGEDLRNFTEAGGGLRRAFTPLAAVPGDSDEFFVSSNQRSIRSRDVYRFNTRTGRFTLLTADSPGDVTRWVLDRNHVPRVAVSVPERDSNDKPRVATVWYRDGEGAKWEKLWEYGLLWKDDDHYQPVAFDYDNETLYVATNKGRDKMAVHAYDTKARKMGNLLLEHPLIDVERGLVFSRERKKLIGVQLDADKPIIAWTDSYFQSVQAAIDKAFPKTTNYLNFARDNEKRALIFSVSDVDPGTYHLYDGEKRSLETIVKTRRWIDPGLMAERRFITYKARDGMEIPAWVTIPKGGGKNLPLIVNIHGGPWVRSYSQIEWGRWPEAQFFASRGYVVLEPEPRGSTGFGRKHYFSAMKQYGLTMQDDITDGAMHLVKEGLVDKDRMCLHGGSYGGYATLQGLVKEPDLWRCGNAFVAVTDLFLRQDITYSDTQQLTDHFQSDDLRMVGDRRLDSDRRQMEATSPARNAARVKAPVLITMGSNDVRVPLAHGEAMRDGLQKAGKQVDYKVYVGEGHGFNLDENVFDFYRRSEKFFADNLKK